MKVRIRLFAQARDLAGCEAVDLELPLRSTVGDLRTELARLKPGLRPLLPHLMVAMDSEYATDETPLTAGAEFACFPPVSGG